MGSVNGFQKPGMSLAVISINGNIDSFANYTCLETTAVDTYPDIQDEPKELEVQNNWLINLGLGILVTIVLAAAAITVGPVIATVALAGAAIGAAVVTTYVAVTDDSDNGRSVGQFAMQLGLGSIIGAATGVGVYLVGVTAPYYAEQIGFGAGMLMENSVLVSTTVSEVATAGGYMVASMVGAFGANRVYQVASGQNIIADKIFDGDVQAYETAEMMIMIVAGEIFMKGAAYAASQGVDIFAKQTRLPESRAQAIAEQSVKGPADSSEVVIGRFEDPEGMGYIEAAETRNAQYLQINDQQFNYRNYSDNQVWKINRNFLQNQLNQGKTIFLSHDPNVYRGGGTFFAREIEFLEQNGYTFIKEGNMWRAVLK